MAICNLLQTTALPLCASVPACHNMLAQSSYLSFSSSALSGGGRRALKPGCRSRPLLTSCPSSGMPRIVCRTGGVETLDVEPVSRSDFPPDFMWGVATSAFQIEGGPGIGGRGYNIWDNFVHFPDRIHNNYLHYPGPNFFEHYREDIDLAAEFGFEAFRISIAWARIYPVPNAIESAEGIDFYNRVINYALRRGLTPIVTLFHWDTPQYLESDPNVLGWRTKNIVPHFVKFADTCYKHFGDRVRFWITINEMWSYAILGHGYGRFAPGRCSTQHVFNPECHAGDSRTEPYLVGHNLLLAHAKAYHHYKNHYKVQQNGICGIAPAHLGAKPFSDSEEDIAAAERLLLFHTGWQLDPVVFGDYPSTMKEMLKERLPSFTEEESQELKNSFDIIGHNYYTASFIEHIDLPENELDRSILNDGGYKMHNNNAAGEPIGPQMGPEASWLFSVPDSFLSLLKWMKKRYGNLPCIISENGIMDQYPYDKESSIADTQRSTYIHDHLKIVSKAINELGLNIKGYLCWSLIDNFEWRDGFLFRFGLVHINFEPDEEATRTPKHAAHWFKHFLSFHTNSFPLAASLQESCEAEVSTLKD